MLVRSFLCRSSLQVNLQKQFIPCVYQNKRFFSSKEDIQTRLKNEFKHHCEAGDISKMMECMDDFAKNGVEINFPMITNVVDCCINNQLYKEAEGVVDTMGEYTRYIKWEWVNKIVAAYKNNGEADKALEFLAKYEDYPFLENHSERISISMEILIEYGAYDAAVDFFNAKLNGETPTLKQLNLLFRAYTEKGDLENAGSVYDRIVKDYKPDHQTKCLYALFLTETGKFDKAISYIKDMENNKPAIKILAHRLLKNENYNDALVLYDTFGIDKIGSNSYSNLVTALSIAGRGDEANDLLEKNIIPKPF